MKMNQFSPTPPYLVVLSDKSILNSGSGDQIFSEGPPAKEARIRANKVKEVLKAGFLETKIAECKNPRIELSDLTDEHKKMLSDLVGQVTSEVGRALVGLSILQLSIKTIAPDQCIRLHKGGSRGDSFSWKQGIPMRGLDSKYITPVLRRFDLLKVNKDGVFMTRSLAENYPYSQVYKAALRGPRKEWIELVDIIEQGSLNCEQALIFLLRLLVARSDYFNNIVEEMLSLVEQYIELKPKLSEVTHLINRFVVESDYNARVFEVALHSLMQALYELDLVDGSLKPITQMRSANKKHKNLGDVEILESKDSSTILEAWDAKYGKPYLRDELDELSEKLIIHREANVVGFVVDREPELKKEILDRMEEINLEFGVDIQIVSFEQWVEYQIPVDYNQPDEYYETGTF